MARPTKRMQAARAELDRRYALRTAAIDAHNEREMKLATDLAELDGRDRPNLDDMNDAWRTLDADRQRIMKARW
jgi:hypothetical protein